MRDEDRPLAITAADTWLSKTSKKRLAKKPEISISRRTNFKKARSSNCSMWPGNIQGKADVSLQPQRKGVRCELAMSSIELPRPLLHV